MTVQGFTLRADLISVEEETALLAFLDAQTWSTVLRRRVQQYGATYDYTTKTLGPAAPIPAPLAALLDRIPELRNQRVQIIVNEYLPGQGISPHTDHYRLFGPVIATLSLGHAVPMVFGRQGVTIDHLLPRRSLAVLAGDARHRWTHAIVGRKADGDVPRSRRVSVTFRTIVE